MKNELVQAIINSAKSGLDENGENIRFTFDKVTIEDIEAAISEASEAGYSGYAILDDDGKVSVSGDKNFAPFINKVEKKVFMCHQIFVEGAPEDLLDKDIPWRGYEPYDPEKRPDLNDEYTFYDDGGVLTERNSMYPYYHCTIVETNHGDIIASHGDIVLVNAFGGSHVSPHYPFKESFERVKEEN